MPVLMVGRKEIPYVVRWSAQAKRKRIVVERGRVEVVVPRGVSHDDVTHFVQTKRRWIYDQRERMLERLQASPYPERFVSGAKIPFRGRQMKLRVQAGARGQAEVEYRGGFHVSVPAHLDEDTQQAEARRAVTTWLRSRLRTDAETFCRMYTHDHGLPPAAGIRAKAQKHLWASCSKNGIISLNERLIAAPKPVLEYVVVHELCHLRHRNHSPAFWSLVRRILPDYEGRKAWLERHGPGLEL
jgi:predicted metal-dependent hydrolase